MEDSQTDVVADSSNLLITEIDEAVREGGLMTVLFECLLFVTAECLLLVEWWLMVWLSAYWLTELVD